MKKKALLSVSNKEGIVKLAKCLVEKDYEILATGNTSKLLTENDINCLEISEFTNFPEIFSGRVKTLHPKVFGGILLRRNNKEDILEAAKTEINPIDIICVNLYPFEKVVFNPEVDEQTKIENIDIGGPSLIRAAAKNYHYVSVLTNPNQYDEFIEELNESEISEETKKKLASEAFAHTAKYDSLIADYFEEKVVGKKSSFRINMPVQSELRYGENPHQKAFLYGDFYKHFEVLHGKALSYNNIIDLISAVNLVNELDNFSCAIIKHTNPCGAATADNILDAYLNALSGDPVSSFGGIVAFNKEINEEVAEKLNEIFTEVICAPSFTKKALEILRKKKNRRLLKTLTNNLLEKNQYRNIPGGIILQSSDDSVFPVNDYKIVT